MRRGGEVGREQALVAEAFFETDDAVLNAEGVAAREASENEERERHYDQPEVQPEVMGPVTNENSDGDAEVEEEDGKQEEVEGWMKARVVFVVLRFWHEVLSLATASAYLGEKQIPYGMTTRRAEAEARGGRRTRLR